jgi:hypothetical protein
MRRWLALLSVSAVSLGAGTAFAQSEPGDWDGGYDAKSKRRSDFTIGTSGGFGFGNASGYPNEVDKIDDPNYRASTELGVGSGGAIWLGVAFNDYLTFGIGFSGLGLSGNDREASAGGFLFHLDGYPLFGVSPALQDLGLFANFGAGGLQVKAKGSGEEQADGGLMSYVEAGVHYERFRFWRIATGPTLSFVHMWSQSGELSGGLLGWRFSFYGGP